MLSQEQIRDMPSFDGNGGDNLVMLAKAGDEAAIAALTEYCALVRAVKIDEQQGLLIPEWEQ